VRRQRKLRPPPSHFQSSRRRRLLDLHYADKISADAFGEEESRLTAQIEALKVEDAEVEAERRRKDALAERFAEVAQLLRTIDIDAV
jgi:hypothetical protein